MDSAEFTEWLALESLEGPLGPRRLDEVVALATANICNAVLCVVGALVGKQQRPLSVDDCRAAWTAEPERRQTPEELEQIRLAYEKAWRSQGRLRNG